MNKESVIFNDIFKILTPYISFQDYDCKQWEKFQTDHIKNILYKKLEEYCYIILTKTNNRNYDDLVNLIASHCYKYIPNCTSNNMLHYNFVSDFIWHVLNIIKNKIGFFSNNIGKTNKNISQYIYKSKIGNLYICKHYDKVISNFDFEFINVNATYHEKNEFINNSFDTVTLLFTLQFNLHI